ncbi:gag/pol protein [Cucumis melo var. makuwa]|uniref:Gag/pol protein n=1 Tax=Cucumis melo var. makuwa TaxID=1194695 RepID=A0A5D3CEL8_CUCMM|nr:gag/pol protein [Cucumis melo var. makuwa]
MDSLKGMFRQPEWSLRHEAIKYIYTKRMKEGTSVREHVLDMMMHFNIAEVNGGAIDEANQVSFILESLPKSFIPFQTNASLNKIEFNLTTLLNELQRFQNLTKGKGKEVETNVATTKGKFKIGSSSKSKVGPLKPNHRIEKKGKRKTPKQNMEKKTTEKGKCYHCGENGHWLRNCPKYLAQKKAEKEAQENSSWKRLSEGEITLKVGTREMVSAKAVGDLKLFFNDRYIILKNVLYAPQIKRNLMSISCKTIKTFRSDRGEEYMDLRFQDYLIEHGIQSQLSAPSTPQQNGVSERRNLTLLDMEYWLTHPSQELGEPRRSGRVVRQPDRYLGLSEAQIIIPNNGIEDPLTYKQAMNDVDCDQWIKAMDLEMESMIINSTVAFLVLYVDDVLLIGHDVGHLADIKKWLATQFQMKDLENAQYVLGIQIVRNRKNKTLVMSQTSHIDKMLSRYKMQNSKKGMLSYRYGIHLSKEQCPKTPQEVEDMSNIPYASAIGSLMYAMLCTRPDIFYSVGIVSRYQSNPDMIIEQLYTDSDFQTDKDARKSTSGSVFTLNGGAVVWRSIKQSCIADSTMETEYVAVCEAAKEALQIHENLEIINEKNRLNETTILSGKSYIEETLQ